MAITKIVRRVNKPVVIRAETSREKKLIQTRKVQNMMLRAIVHFHAALSFFDTNIWALLRIIKS